METVNMEIKRHLVHFRKSENKIKAIYHLKEILYILNEKKDPRTQEFLKQIQKKLNFQIGQTHWKKLSIDYPEIGLHGFTINKCLFMENELKQKIVYAPDNSRISTWDYINKDITLKYENYINLYEKMVA